MNLCVCIYMYMKCIFLIRKKCIQSTRCYLISSEETIVDKLKELAILLSFVSVSNLQIWETAGPNGEYRWGEECPLWESTMIHNFLGVLSKSIGAWSLHMNFIYPSFHPSHDLFHFQGDFKLGFSEKNYTVSTWNEYFVSKSLGLILQEKIYLVDFNESVSKELIFFK